MNNYFGIGLDAKISLEFNNKRDEHPKKCRYDHLFSIHHKHISTFFFVGNSPEDLNFTSLHIWIFIEI